MTQPTRVLVVEDDLRIQQAISLALPTYTLSFASTAEAGLELAPQVDAQLFLVDLGLPDLDGVLLIERLVALKPGVPILVLTSASSRERVLSALRAGASGYLLKEEAATRLPTAINEVLAGGMPMSAAAAKFVLEQLRGLAPPPVGSRALTDREREVLQLLARGLTYDQAADSLGVSINTIRTYVRAIYEKLNASGKAEAVMIALREGWIAS